MKKRASRHEGLAAAAIAWMDISNVFIVRLPAAWRRYNEVKKGR
ncbi:hypothetical protein AFE_2046 [Acidithiobacillus ferrooxidans ATCC 23270]|uniref:Uncharacterized protein n=1 Tax=Acidithiobacillus ferrooxidans (strain ATCC 23270 / DSM 14882 / CIP 104768 / NCIMB 8455) TaxID=243159 RepID=B7J4Q7_ACIF2|nr:hypothetical protein AFE_2046 [Acidithiobacillus ferrooxidans ATCC 23270]